METLRWYYPARGSVQRGLFSWWLTVIFFLSFHLIFLTAFLLCDLMSLAFADGTAITVDAAQLQGDIAPRLFGENVVFDSNTMWDHRTDTLRSEPDNTNVIVKSRIEELAPTILRFPGGGYSDLHIWEDGLGIQTLNPLVTGSTEIFLAESPQSRVPGPGIIIDPLTGQFGETLMGQLGDSINFPGVDKVNNKLTGVSNISVAHSAGAWVRPGKRQGEIWEYWTNTYGIIEHLKLVKSLGAEVLITVNYSTGLDNTGSISANVSLSQRIMRAQALVAFCNGSASDNRSLGTDGDNTDWHTVGYWASKRAALGFPDPFNVLYWEVGNEIYSSSDAGHATAQIYASNFNQFAQQMKNVDPSIKIGAVGLDMPDDPGDGDTQPWNATVVQQTKENLDFLVVHCYYPSQTSDDPASSNWFKLVMAGATQVRENLADIRSIINNNAPGKDIGLAVTEYGFWPYHGQEAPKAEYNSNLARALHDADLLMCLIKDDAQGNLRLRAAAAWDLHSTNLGAAIGFKWDNTRIIHPQYYALKMLRQNLVSRKLVQTIVLSSPTFPVNAGGNIEAHPAVPCLEALGALSATGRNLTLLVINRSLDSQITATIQLNNLSFAPKSAMVTKLRSENLGDNNENGEVVKPSDPVPLTIPEGQSIQSFDYAFEPHSLTIIEFKPILNLSAPNLLILDD